MNSLHSLLNSPVTIALGWTLLHSLWQGALITVLLLVILPLLHSSLARYLAACLALALLAMCSLGSFIYLQPLAPSSVPPAPIVPDDLTQSPFIESAIGSVVAPGAVSQSFLESALPWITFFYLVGVAILCLRNIGGWIAVQRLRCLGTQNVTESLQATLHKLSRRLEISRPVQLLQSAWVQTPLAFGAFKPLILMPAVLLTRLPAAQIEAILLHELAHIRRHDYMANLFQTVLDTLFFYHPAVWWISARIRAERENCCDDTVVAFTQDRETYACALANLAESSATLAMAASGGSLLHRIQRVLGMPRQSPRCLWSGASLATGALLLLFYFCGNLNAKPPATTNFKSEAQAALARQNTQQADLQATVGNWSQSDPIAAAAWVLQLPEDPLRRPLIRAVAEEWAATDALAAAGWAVQLQNPDEQKDAISVVIQTWVDKDIQAAANWAIQLKDKKLQWAARMVLMSWAQRDPAAEAKWADQLENKKLRWLARWPISQEWPKKEPVAALQWAMQLPTDENRDMVLGEMVLHWAQKDPRAAAEWAMQLPEGKDKKSACAFVASRWVEQDAAAAIQWASEIGDPAARQSAFSLMSSSWSRNEKLLANKEMSDKLADTFTKEILKNRYFMFGALWARQLPAGATKDRATKEILDAWTLQDPKAVEIWQANIKKPQ